MHPALASASRPALRACLKASVAGTIPAAKPTGSVAVGLFAFILIGGPWVGLTAWLWHRAGGVEAWRQAVHGRVPDQV
jgi:hypothetical protein